MAAVAHQFIHGRDEFFQVLSWAKGKAQQYAGSDYLGKGFLWRSWLEAIERMESQTAAGRTPTKDERVAIQIDRSLSRAFDDFGTAETEEFVGRLGEVVFYFKHWKSDADWNALDTTDLEALYPDEYAR